jgi:hypothetical protein
MNIASDPLGTVAGLVLPKVFRESIDDGSTFKAFLNSYAHTKTVFSRRVNYFS